MQRSRQPVAAQSRAATRRRVEDGDVESRLHHGVVLDTEPTQELAIRGTAPKEHVLTVVDDDLGTDVATVLATVERAGERVGRTTASGARLEQGDRPAGVGRGDSGSQPGDATADDHEGRLARGTGHRRL